MWKIFERVCLPLGIGLLWTFSLCVAQPASKFTADFHGQEGLQCLGCHGETKPTTPAGGDACVMCHDGFAELAKRTENLTPNPHSNHYVAATEPECIECHKGHRADKVLCVDCHSGLKFEKK
jgi:fumarate reductase flavoprotein subunit